ncbi:MAG: hypothetical protein QHH10_08155 [Peptococcaceae bacterium]|jgi:hypothetical protein|nr:hypothetical protein [Peptococcaceae bacterium]MDH7525266.1 hypothetical protein [Peptococcaceae bacterium]
MSISIKKANSYFSKVQNVVRNGESLVGIIAPPLHSNYKSIFEPIKGLIDKIFDEQTE